MIALTTQQIESIVARALPGEGLRASRALAGERYALTLTGGETLNVQLYDSSQAATTAAAALRMLRGEVDLPIPALRASDAEGQTVGTPYLLLSEVGGEPLDQVVARIGDEQLYRLGRQLGEIVQRIHRLICPRYGTLGGADNAAGAETGDERGYALARLAEGIRQCGALGALDRRTGAEIMEGFERQFRPVGRQPALLHGRLEPRRILVRHSQGGWKISGLLGWEQALGWSPAWEHVILLDTTDDPRFFGLRVGYGNGYDEQTARPYEQVREHALAPYRILLHIQRMQEAGARGDIAECERRRGMLRGLIPILDA
jgi:aminoglycoside phosphotransferase (APT) family kinase protein